MPLDAFTKKGDARSPAVTHRSTCKQCDNRRRRPIYSLPVVERPRLPVIPAEFRARTIKAAERTRHDPHGFVYVLVHPLMPGYCKIGWARDLNARLSDYNVGDPLKRYTFKAWGYFDSAKEAEAECHSAFDFARIPGGEWFSGIVNTASHYIEACSQAEVA